MFCVLFPRLVRLPTRRSGFGGGPEEARRGKGPDPFVLSCSLTEISGALKALKACPHMYNVLISSVLMSTWFVWTAFVAVCLASPAARHSSRGRLLMEEIPPSLPSAGQVRGTLVFVPSVVTLNTSIMAGFSNFTN